MDRIGITDLRAHLSQYLRRVRRGQTLTIHDRDQPVARIVPFASEAGAHDDGLGIRRATRRPCDLPLPGPLDAATDSLATLLEDRAAR
jgi:prevent-host-death family protein